MSVKLYIAYKNLSRPHWKRDHDSRLLKRSVEKCHKNVVQENLKVIFKELNNNKWKLKILDPL